MCTFKEEVTDKTQFTGYKIAAKRDGKYYSIATGIEYKIGLVEVPKSQKKIITDWGNILNPYNQFYLSNYIGMTAVFEDLCEAKTALKSLHSNELLSGYELVILKMTIQKTKTKNCYEGYWNFNFPPSTVYIGPKIRSMKELGS
jgi:hypothetical protein